MKRKSDGSIERYKAQLLVASHSSMYGIYYAETFAPVAKMTTVRVLISLAASKSLRLWQMDVQNAFLYGDIDREIFTEQPAGVVSKTNPEYVCKLKKALYGLKQAPRAWYRKIA